MAPPAYSPPLSRQTSHTSSATSAWDNVTLQLQLQRSKSASTISSTTTTWTPVQESRLLHCQTELHSAQKRWSASQELWIEEVEQLSEMKKKHLKAIKKQDQDIRAKKAVGIWKRKTWKRSLSRKESGAVTPVTAPVTRAGSEDEEGDDDDGDEDEDGANEDKDGEEMMMPIRRRSEGVTVDLSSSPLPSRPATPSSPPSPRRPSIAVTLRKLSVPGIRRRSTAPVGEGIGSDEGTGGVSVRSPTDLSGGGEGLAGSGLKRRVAG